MKETKAFVAYKLNLNGVCKTESKRRRNEPYREVLGLARDVSVLRKDK